MGKNESPRPSDERPASSLYDVFISYADADRAWVDGFLIDGLERAGVRCHREAAFRPRRPQARGIREGRPIQCPDLDRPLARLFLDGDGLVRRSPGPDLRPGDIDLARDPATARAGQAADPPGDADVARRHRPGRTRTCARKAQQPVPAADSRCAGSPRVSIPRHAGVHAGRPIPLLRPGPRMRRTAAAFATEPVPHRDRRVRAAASRRWSLPDSCPGSGRRPCSGRAKWLVRSMRPGEQPLAELAQVLGAPTRAIRPPPWPTRWKPTRRRRGSSWSWTSSKRSSPDPEKPEPWPRRRPGVCRPWGARKSAIGRSPSSSVGRSRAC